MLGLQKQNLSVKEKTNQIKPFFITGNGCLYNGNSLKILKHLPNESIDCVLTSPPYWALRDYETEKQIWDDSYEVCSHIWKDNFCINCGAWHGELGLEPTYELYLKHLIDIFNEIKRVLKPTGTCWVNLGDTYGGSGAYNKEKSSNLKQRIDGSKKYTNRNIAPKSLLQLPFRFSIKMTENGWLLRNTLIWHKPNAMPSSVKDRFTVDFEYLFFFTKNKKYYFEQQFEPYKNGKDVEYRKWLRENKTYSTKKPYKKNTPFCHQLNHKAWDNDKSLSRGKNSVMKVNPNGRNKRCIWTIKTKPYQEAHFATYPEELCSIPIKAGSPKKNAVVLDPFFGAGTTGLASEKLGRKWIGIELNNDYCNIAKKRINKKINQ